MDSKTEVARALWAGKQTVKQITEAVLLNPSTVNKRLNEYEKCGAVTVTQERTGKTNTPTKFYSPTEALARPPESLPAPKPRGKQRMRNRDPLMMALYPALSAVM